MRQARALLGAALLAPAFAEAAHAQDGTTPATTPVQCEPFGGLESADVVRRIREDGLAETTQFLRRGHYIVSRCDQRGLLREQQHVLNLPTPRGRLFVLAERIRRVRGGMDLRWNSAVFLARPDGKLALRPGRRGELPFEPSARRMLADPIAAITQATRTASDKGCHQNGHVEGKFKVAGGSYGYVARIKSMPHGDKDRERITKGHHAWNKTQNPCKIADKTNVLASYEGTTKETVHTYADGHNVVDFGDPSVIGCSSGGGAIVVACTQGISRDGKTFSDIDQRYTNLEGKHFLSTGSPAPDQADLWSVAAHETGHSLGVRHSNGDNWLTMYPTTIQGNTRMRDLGRGDTEALRCQYDAAATNC